MSAQRWRPNLSGQVSQDTEYAIRRAFDMIYELQDRPAAAAGAAGKQGLTLKTGLVVGGSGSGAGTVAVPSSASGLGSPSARIARSQAQMAQSAAAVSSAPVHGLGASRVGTFSNLPVGLGVADTGFIFYATDAGHAWMWNGSGWQWAPGDPGSGWIAGFESDPGAGWKPCDGSAATVYTSSGGTASVPTQNMNSDVLIEGGSSVGVRAASAPTWAAPHTDDEAAHTHAE
jgi:hypothetical protein